MHIGKVYSYTINELPVQTGDLICTSDAGGALQAGQFWRLIGKLIPGEIEHIAVYVGPGDRCVEVGARGHVVAYELGGHTWNAHGMIDQRGLVIDSFYGIAYPLEGRGLPEEKIEEIRKSVAEYCLHQAETRKPYNLNFLDSQTEKAFYCSQLAYKAYLRHDIDLNTGLEIPAVSGTGSVVFPQEIWNCCAHRKP